MFLLQTWNTSRICQVQSKNITFSDLGDLPVASFCQCRADYYSGIVTLYLLIGDCGEQFSFIWKWVRVNYNVICLTVSVTGVFGLYIVFYLCLIFMVQ